MLWEWVGFPTLAMKVTALRLGGRRSDAMVPCRAAAPVGAHYPVSFPTVTNLLALMTCRPTAVPHCLIVDDVYEGYFLPTGSIPMETCGKLIRFRIPASLAERWLRW